MNPYELTLADAIYSAETVRDRSNLTPKQSVQNANWLLDFILANTLINGVREDLLDAIERVAVPHEANLPGLAKFRERRAAKKAAVGT